MAEYRPWHLVTCPARDAAAVGDDGIRDACTCSPERFLDPFAEPVPEPDVAAESH